jgi:hypothetical protein
MRRNWFIRLGLLPILFGLAVGTPSCHTPLHNGPAEEQATRQPAANSRPAALEGQLPPADPTRPGVRPADSPIIQFDRPVCNFGRIIAGKPMRHDFRFTNRGNQPLLISQVKLSCGCTKAGRYDKNVAPGESGKIPISMNTKTLKGKTFKSVIVTTNDPGLPTLRLQLTGEVVPLIEVDPALASFGTVENDIKEMRVLTIVNNMDKPLEFTGIQHDSAKFETDLKTLKPGKEFELTVTALPPFESGYTHGAIFLQTNLPEVPFVTIRSTAFRPSAITVTPKLITLGSPLPTDFSQQILVRHCKGRPLKLTDLDVTGEGLKVSLQGPPPGVQLRRITLTAPAGYKLPERGERITFKTDDPSMPLVTVRVVQYQRGTGLKRRPAIKRDTDRANSLLKFAERLLDKGDQETAENWLQRLIERFPKSQAAEEAKRLLNQAAPQTGDAETSALQNYLVRRVG